LLGDVVFLLMVFSPMPVYSCPLMMQLWADYLDKLKAGAEVIPLRGQVA